MKIRNGNEKTYFYIECLVQTFRQIKNMHGSWIQYNRYKRKYILYDTFETYSDIFYYQSTTNVAWQNELA